MAVTLFFESGGSAAASGNPTTNAPFTQATAIHSISDSDSEEFGGAAAVEEFVPVVERGGVISAASADAGTRSVGRIGRIRQLFSAFSHHGNTEHGDNSDDSGPDSDQVVTLGGISGAPSQDPSHNAAQVFGNPFNQSASSLASNANLERSRRLADLFRPPLAILHPSNCFDPARRHAKNQGRYLIVALHDPADFASQAANRDWWNDQALQVLIQQRFVYVQFNVGGAEAQRYCSFYPLNETLLPSNEGMYFPHVALIDPRTGERVRVLAEFSSIPIAGRQVIDARQLGEILTGFASTHPMEPLSSQAPGPSFTQVVSGEGSDVEFNDKRAKLDAEVSRTEAPQEQAREPRALIAVPDEPAANSPNSTLIQFRLPDGSRQKRRFNLSDCTAVLYAVAHGLCGSFSALRSHDGNIPESPLLSLSDAKLSNALVTIVK